MYFLLLDNALKSVDSKEDFLMLVQVGFVLTCKAVEHTRIVYATLELMLSDDPLFSLLLLPELDKSLQSFKNYLS